MKPTILNLIFSIMIIAVVEPVGAGSGSYFQYVKASHADLTISEIKDNGDIITYTRLQGVYNIYVPVHSYNHTTSHIDKTMKARSHFSYDKSSAKKVRPTMIAQTPLHQQIEDCGKIKIYQTFGVNGCIKTIRLSVCTGSCPKLSPKDKQVIFRFCRLHLANDRRLDFDCPSLKPGTHLIIKDAVHCECVADKLRKVINGN